MIITKWKIIGVTPLLQNNPSGTLGKEGGDIIKKKKYPPKEEAEKRTYQTKEGLFYIPINSFRKSLLEGGKGMTMGGTMGATTILMGGVFPVDDADICILLDEKDKPIKSYVIDIRRVVIKGQGVLRARPKFFPWQTYVRFEVEDALVPIDKMVMVFSRAGKVCGVGDYRPEKKGWFGRYEVELIEKNEIEIS